MQVDNSFRRKAGYILHDSLTAYRETVMSVPSIPKYDSPRPEGGVLSREEVKARFDNEAAAVYSQGNPVYLPDFASAFALVIEALQIHLPASPWLLDLGAGTGNLSRRILAAIPGSHSTLVDFSPNMLDGAPVVLADYQARYDTICADFFEASFPDRHFDAVVSSFALHHARGDGEYLRLYRRIHGWLKPAGVFACCDVVNGDNAGWTAINENGWKNYLREVNFTEQEIARIFESYHVEDTPISLSKHLTLLQQAGFRHVDVLWKRYNFAVYCAQS
jgi:tRNA (cmo5U34)-methyltransferase